MSTFRPKRHREGDPNQLPIEWHPKQESTPPPLQVPSTGTAQGDASPAPHRVDAAAVSDSHQPKDLKPKPRSSHGQVGRRAIARLPVPRPLPTAVASGRFGHDEQGRPIRPDAVEIRAITEQRAFALIEMLELIEKATPADQEGMRAGVAEGITEYAEDFGEEAARQLEAFIRRMASWRDSDLPLQNHWNR